MNNAENVYLLVLSGELAAAQQFLGEHYPGYPVVQLSKRDLRESGLRARVGRLRTLKGKAVVIFSNSVDTVREPLLLLGSGLVHRCRETVLADEQGRSKRYTRWRLRALVPIIFLSGMFDLMVLGASWVGLQVLLRGLIKQREIRPRAQGELDIALLDPLFEPATAGGAMSYLDGTLSGMAKAGISCEIFSGRTLPTKWYPVHVIPGRRRLNLLRECQGLSYSLHFALGAWKQLRGRRPRMLYQRHGAFGFSGALLAWLTRTPLVLEFQGSEVWLAKNWDPSRFQPWLALCERISILASSRVVVLCKALRDDVTALGYPAEKIIMNPAAVDPERFRPGCGGREVREKLGLAPHHTLVSFVGSFSYYHGMPVLARAITMLLKRRKEVPALENLRFMLVGDGLLRADTQEALSKVEGSEAVIFTGLLPHASVPGYLDASDILVSPQVPNADGQPFFGSPTKLFEYMAMEKAIVASNMDQLALVLRHKKTGWLVTPGSDVELANAIELLALNPEVRKDLGRKARANALQFHTWQLNAVRFLSRTNPHEQATQGEGAPHLSSAAQGEGQPLAVAGQRN